MQTYWCHVIALRILWSMASKKLHHESTQTSSEQRGSHFQFLIVYSTENSMWSKLEPGKEGSRELLVSHTEVLVTVIRIFDWQNLLCSEALEHVNVSLTLVFGVW